LVDAGITKVATGSDIFPPRTSLPFLFRLGSLLSLTDVTSDLLLDPDSDVTSDFSEALPGGSRVV
jgi:hypothetical protein